MIVFFGQPGAGKTTQGKILAANQGWCWIAAGQLLRESVDPEITKILKEGKLVSPEVIIELIGGALEKNSDCENIIIDGFARCVEQAEWLIDQASAFNRTVDAIIVIDIPKDALIKRLTDRGRSDDTPEVIEQRLNVYNEETHPVLEYFDKRGVKVVHIDGIGTEEEVNARVMKELTECKLV